jgi:hypothetical protein
MKLFLVLLIAAVIAFIYRDEITARMNKVQNDVNESMDSSRNNSEKPGTMRDPTGGLATPAPIPGQ